MARTSPYSFPARSRADMLAAIADIGNQRGYDHKVWPFCWNVKLPYVADSHTAATLNPFHYDGGTFDPALDSEWEAEMQEDDFDYGLIEDMRRSVEEWTMYPGVDADQFEFGFYGRSGGWLVLESAYGVKMAGLHVEDLADAEEYDFAFIRNLYRALIVMDQDFGRDKVKAEMLHQIAFRRTQWEEEKREAKEAANKALAEEMEQARPDLYGAPV